MRKKLLFGLLVLTLMALPLLSACGGQATPSLTPPTVKTPSPGTPTPTGAANWWDKLGEPKYGGTLLIREMSLDNIGFDPTAWGLEGGSGYWETLFCYDWTLDRETWAYNCGYVPMEYTKCLLAESWERTDPQTITVKLKQGIHWWENSPANGREFTSDDVEFTYDMALGTGHGFTEPNLFLASGLTGIERVVATDKYTVEFRLKSPSLTGVEQALGGSFILPVEHAQVTDRHDPTQVAGTGPFIPTDMAVGSSMTFSRNPNYWGHDERYPDNQLPYVDELKHVSIPDTATALAAIRTGKVDMITDYKGAPSWQQALSLSESNPEINVRFLPQPGYAIDFRCDQEPFTDIRVRTALQMALDLKTMADTIWGGTAFGGGTPVGLIDPLIKGYVIPYEEWSPELKAEYSYDPEGARALLAEAGYPNGFDTNIVASAADNMDFLQAVKSYFMDVGVDMEIRAMEHQTYMSFVADGKEDQMTLSPWCGTFSSPSSPLNVRTSRHPWNYTFHNDTHYDDLVKQYDAATEVAEAQAICQEAVQYLLEKHYSISTFTRSMCIMWSPRVKGYSGELLTFYQSNGWYRARFWLED